MRNDLREQFGLALPIMLTHLGMMLMGVVDTAILGRYSETALGAAGMANSVLFAVLVLGMGTVMGLDTMIPQALGAGERRRARELLDLGVRLAVLIGAPITVLVAVTPSVFGPAGVDAELAFDARVYVYARLPGIVPVLVFTAARAYLMALKRTRPLVLATVVGNLVNLVFDYALVFGVPSLGIPSLGVIGAAATTTLVSIAQLVVVLSAARRASRATPDDDTPGARPGDRAAILRLGIPVGLQLGAEVGIFALVGVLAGRIGERAAAGHNVALMLASFSFSAALGMSAATSVRVGHAVGAGDVHGTRRAGLVGLLTGAGVMLVPLCAFLIAPRALIRVLTDNADVIAAAAPLLGVAAFFQLFDGAQVVAAGALRGAGDTRASFVGNAIGHYAIGVPVAIALGFGAGLGVIGLWWGLCAGLTAVAIGLWLRFFWLAKRPIARV